MFTPSVTTTPCTPAPAHVTTPRTVAFGSIFDQSTPSSGEGVGSTGFSCSPGSSPESEQQMPPADIASRAANKSSSFFMVAVLAVCGMGRPSGKAGKGRSSSLRFDRSLHAAICYSGWRNIRGCWSAPRPGPRRSCSGSGARWRSRSRRCRGRSSGEAGCRRSAVRESPGEVRN